MTSSIHLHKELKKLDIRVRNQVRAIVSSEVGDAVRILNKLREKRSVSELVQIDNVLALYGNYSNLSMPELFPAHVETAENYRRLVVLPLEKSLALLDYISKIHRSKVASGVACFNKINSAIISKRFELASALVGSAVEVMGASHYILRKSALISVQKSEKSNVPEVDEILELAGIKNNNLISSSILNCFQEGQDFLSMKKSLLNLPDKGPANKFTRDMLRLAFHPHAVDSVDLAELIQSNLQSSFVDAVLMAKINQHIFDVSEYSNLQAVFGMLENTSSIEDIADQYTNEEEGEELFYKRSSAWLENISVVKYRTLQDSFYDFPESPYIKFSDSLMARVGAWVADIGLIDLPRTQMMTRHNIASLSRLESDGYTTRSSVFNYLIAKSEGYSEISEEGLIFLMGHTRDLSKTINPVYLRNLAACTSSPLSKLIYYLLIARKSKNERDDHQLRRVLQQLVLQSDKGGLPDFVAEVSGKSRAVAEYMYEVFTEDFIAKLSKIVETASQITETRAALHRFMGDMTGDKIYSDRARTILIDHQINKLRNEIDDNRIYVDASRFHEWINDELMRDLNAILTAMEIVNSPEQKEANPQILQIIRKCYDAFCESTVFGIASYLGRRIRHGTFRGHLYSSVINFAKATKYEPLLSEHQVSQIWASWQARYEEVIAEIIVERLHVESSGKKQALLKIGLEGAHKVDVANACAKTLWRDYSERKTSQAAPQILTEYCWRLLEVDLKSVNAFLKGKKQELLGADLLSQIKNSALRSDLAAVFVRDLTHHINDRLTTMYGWFKQPVSVSPKASLSLLFRAVVAEVQDTYSSFCVNQEYDQDQDIELVGGAYHVLYDAFYVVIYNAAKHGKVNGKVQRIFKLVNSDCGRKVAVNITISSEIKECESEEFVRSRLIVHSDDNFANAQVSEDRSGIRKLYQLACSDQNFFIEYLGCVNRQVVVSMSYSLEH